MWSLRSTLVGQHTLREGGLLDVAQVGELLLEVGIALALDLALVGRLAITREDGLRNVKSLRHLADGREALLVEESVVAVVDEHLRGARAWASRREDDGTPLVGHLSTEVRSKCKCKYV